MRNKSPFLILILLAQVIFGQGVSSSELLHQLHQSQNPLRVLYLAAHPDDENTRMISWLANDIGAQTAYLSLTRGDGGQNLIGTELGAKLGVLRTQELMQARAIDGGQQFFSRAVDFGYSKNADETFQQWDRNLVLSDVVRVIRTFKPQIIITRFPPDGRGGHGHHTASAMLALEAYEVAADPKAFPEQNLEAWQVNRIFWNHSAWWEPKIDSLAAADPTYFVEEVGSYLPEMGLSCNELASYSRSQHKSQGFGVAVARGAQKEYLKLMKGEVPGKSIFSGLNQSWKQNGREDIEKALASIEANYDLRKPYKSAAELLKLYQSIGPDDESLQWLREDLSHLIAQSLGLKVEVLAKAEYATYGSEIDLVLKAIHRSPIDVSVLNLAKQMEVGLDAEVEYNEVLKENEVFEVSFKYNLDDDAYSQPYWLKEPYDAMFKVDDPMLIGKPENDPSVQFAIWVHLEQGSFKLMVPVRYKFSDRVEGEIERPLMVVPPLTVKSRINKLFFLDNAAQSLELDFKAFEAGTYEVYLDTEAWQIEPAQFVVEFTESAQVVSKRITVSPKMGAAPGSLYVMLKKADGSDEALKSLVEIDYPHIDKRMILEDPAIRLIPMQLEKRGNRVAYIIGAGDKVPDAINQMGYDVDILDEQALRESNLDQYQAVILGIRAYNTQSWLFNRKDQLLDYVKGGGNMIVQYNTRSRSFQGDDFAPYPFKISRERVTEENAPVRFNLPDHPVLNEPNKLSKVDFNDWVQERGLYFASEWDPAYAAPLAWHDKDEPDRLGGLLIADYGEGAFIYTGISFFRELPAGVPGAYRLLANLISYEHEK